MTRGIIRPSTAAVTRALLLLVSCLPALHSRPTHGNSLQAVDGDDDGGFPAEPIDSPAFWWKLAVSVVLVLLGGVFAGLTLALLSQDEITLQVLAVSGETSQKRDAQKVLRLLKRGKHWVLCTLLLSNVVVNETLPIVFDSVLGGGWPAVVLSTALIVIFGEIIPQAACINYGLPIGARCSGFVLGMMYVLYPLAYPTALLLDRVLGKEEGTTYKKAGLKTLVSLHRTLGTERLNDDEVTIITAVLDLKEKPVGDIMTPLKDVYVMAADQIMDVKTMNDILSKGYSRIPIHARGNQEDFIGMLLVKTMITYDPEDEWPVSAFTLATLPETKPNTSALDILNYFQEGKAHMVLVSDHPGENHGALGVVTLEDVIEELIGEEIVDETDVFVDVSRHLKRVTPSAAFAHHAFHRISSRHLLRRSPDSTNGPPNAAKANTPPPLSRGTSGYFTSPTSKTATVGTMKPLNLAQEPLFTTSTKVTIKPGAEVRSAQQAATVLSQEERLAGKRAARDSTTTYGTVGQAAGAVTAEQGTNAERSQTGPTLMEERITVPQDSTRPSKVVISPVIEAHDNEDHHERTPLL